MTREKIEQHFGESWVDFMAPFMQGEGWAKINAELVNMKKEGTKFAPDVPSVFRAFRETPLDKVRVVILGQDPYPVAGYANGLAYSHDKKLKTAASLQMVIDAIETDCYNGLDFNKSEFDTELTGWCKQGVLLFNTALTVPYPKEGQRLADVVGAHKELWQPFAEYVIKKLEQVKRHVIFLSWGQEAQSFTKDISPFLHFVFTAEHPSRAAVEKRPWKCRHFSIVNSTITASNLGDRIKW